MSSRIEQHTIYQIPLDQRHGKARQLFTLWFGANLNVLTVVTGALGTTIFHQSFLSAVLAILLGNLIGTIFMALHAAQGPRLGVPQMVQSRGQFGAKGAGFVVALVAFMYVGYAATAFVTGGQSVHFIVPALGADAAIIAIGAISLAGAIYGHDLIHFSTRMMTYVSGSALLLAFIWVLIVTPIPGYFLTQGSFSPVGFFKMVSMGALWQLGYAPYVSDYSRYLPRDVGVRESFWWTYLGAFVGGAWMMLVGSVAAAAAPRLDVAAAMEYAADLVTPGLGRVLLLAALFGLLTITALNFYGASLTLLSVADTIKPLRCTVGKRVASLLVAFVCSCAIALSSSSDFVGRFSDYLALLLYLFTPWTAINLVDFYVVRRGHYSIREIFNPAGMYGHWNWRGLAAYLMGFAVMIPFFSTDVWKGPVARALGGADIAMLIGLPVAAGVYLLACRSMDLMHDRQRASAADIGLDPDDAYPRAVPTRAAPTGRVSTARMSGSQKASGPAR